MSDIRIKFNNESLPISTIISRIIAFKKGIGNDRLDLQPEYQRGAIWNDDFKEKLIFSILSRYPIGSIIIRNLDKRNIKGADTEVVDGQQRLTTIFEFVSGKVALSDSLSKRVIEDNKESYQFDIENGEKHSKAVKIYNDFIKGKKISLNYETLSSSMKYDFDSYNLALTYISHHDDNVIAEFFRFVQNQERLRAGEIINSIPDSPLEKYLDMVNVNSLTAKLNWVDKRKEFDKLFYAAIGIFDEKLPMGGVDAEIIEYVKNANEISGLTLERTQLLIKQLNCIAVSQIQFNSGINKRYIKFLFMLAGYNLIDFSINTAEKMLKLKGINEKLSAFSSAKADALSKEFVGYTDEQVEHYRLIALISKGAQKHTLIEERMKLLAELMSL